MLEDRLIEELDAQFCGCRMEEDASLTEERLLEESGILEDDAGNDIDITETMSIQIELDESNRIESIYVSFHTCGLDEFDSYEADPDEFFDFDTCYDEACMFIQEQLIDEDADED